MDYHRNTFAFYGQDDIQVNDRLTLNLGLRYELFMPVTEGKNEMATFDFRTDTLIVPRGQNATAQPRHSFVLAPPERTRLAGLISPDYTDFAPRVGFAYKLSEQAGDARRLRNFLRRRGERSVFISQSGVQSAILRHQSFSSPCGSPAPANANAATLETAPSG